MNAIWQYGNNPSAVGAAIVENKPHPSPLVKGRGLVILSLRLNRYEGVLFLLKDMKCKLIFLPSTKKVVLLRHNTLTEVDSMCMTIRRETRCHIFLCCRSSD